MNFQVTVLKVLVSYPDGFATMEDLKRDMAILATSGREWTDRTKRLAARVPGLDIFSQALIERISGGWKITDKGRAVLDLMEQRPADPLPVSISPPPAPVTQGKSTVQIRAGRSRSELARRRLLRVPRRRTQIRAS
ncbi:hypothetical protein [Bradyrhizobium stylosanthis]|uniref:hypothetical protein n=1 Tax=Bradyrhizobium stylosanthis TaxID=1803665 RepID=UPI0007C4FAA7|nr:hypothetical protein [Bradyrhizobium stylosanthis]